MGIPAIYVGKPGIFQVALPSPKPLGASCAAPRVEYHWTLERTNTGPAGTGHKVPISGYDEWKFSLDDLIEDSLGHFDVNEYQRQLTCGFSS